MTKRKIQFLVLTFVNIIQCGFILADIFWVVIGWSSDPDPTELEVPMQSGRIQIDNFNPECKLIYF